MVSDPVELKPKSKRSAAHWRHGHASHEHPSGGKATPTYRSWQAMRTRCNNPHRDNGDRYFNKGITVCEQWSSFDAFLRDMGERPAGKTLDRIESMKGYSPDNCRWATPIEQARNTQHTKLTFETASQIAELRLRGMKCKDIAAKFGVSESLPREIVKGRCWVDALRAARDRMECSNA